MAAPSLTSDQNLLPVQAYFNLDGSFNTFIGQGQPFYATLNPSQSGLNITNSTINSTTIGLVTPSSGVFTNISTTTGSISTTPNNPTDIVNKSYVDAVAQGLAFKQPAQVATTVNITLSGLQTIDGYTTLVGDRVLVKNQTNQANNGIYVASASAWSRSSDANTYAELVSAFLFVESGGQSGSAWVSTIQQNGTLGTTAITFSQFSNSALYTAGTGLSLSGYQFSITPQGTAGTYGSASSVPVFITNASGQVTSVTNTSISIAPSQINATIPNSGLTNSSITINGNSVSLGGSTTVTAVNPFALTIGTGLSGTSYNGSAAVTIANSGVLSFSGGTTGLTPSTATTGAISLAGTLVVGNGGTGATTLTGYVYGNGTSAFTASTTIPNTAITGLGTMSTQNANSVAITGGTINGTSIGATTRSTGDFTTLSGNTVTSTTPVLSFNAANTIASFGSTTANSYNQLVIQNLSGTSGASTNYVISNDLGTDSTYYGEFGMNSSVYTGAGVPSDFFSINNGIYFSGHDGDITVGSGNGKKLYFAWGTSGQSAHVINASGAIGLNTNLAAGTGSGTTNYGTSGQAMLSGGSSATPTWGILGLSGGGTNANLTASAGAIAYSTASALALSSVGTTGQYLQSNGTGAPTWTTPSASVTISDQTVSSSTFYPAFLPSTSGTVTTIDTSSTKLQYVPSTGTLTSTVFSGAGTGLTGTASSLSIGGNAATATSATTATNLAGGANGSLPYQTGSGATTFLATGTNGYILTLASGVPTWASAPVSGITITDNTSSSSTYYPTLTTATTGTITGETTSSTQLSFVPNTGLLTTKAISLSISALTSSNTSNFSIGGNLGFSDTGVVNNFVGTTNSYLQSVIQNKSNGASASAEFIAYNDSGTASANFATFGINSSGYTGTGAINAPGYGYFLSGSTDIVVGTIGNNAIHFVVNSGATDALTISTAGNVTTPNVLTGAEVVASNGLVINSKTVSASYTLPSGSNAMSVGPITISSGQAVTVPSGQRWVIL